jgi:hypothetical protein
MQGCNTNKLQLLSFYRLPHQVAVNQIHGNK